MKQMITEMKMKFENTSSNHNNRKPDYLDFDGDGNESESMVKALADKKEAAWTKFQKDRFVTRKTVVAARREFEQDYAKTESINDIDEQSVTGGVAGYQTPYAFSKTPNKIKYPGVAEAMEKQYEKLIEGYRQYAAADPKMSAESKVNSTIIEISKKLRDIEESVHNVSRLKEESGITREGYNKRTNTALDTISERLVKISERVRNLMH